MSRVLAVFATIFILATSTLSAGTYYVSNIGSDSNSGSSTSPFATIQKAADVAVAGDTVIVRAGTYVGAKFSKSGTSSSPIRFQGEPGAVVNSKGALNSNNDNLWIRNASYITIEGFEIHSSLRAGIAIQGEPTAEVHGIVIRNNFCHNNSRWGIFTGYAEGILIENNETSYSSIEHGIYVSNSSDNPVIRRNKAHHNNASGIQINADPALAGDGIISNALIELNEIYTNGVGGGAAINLASVAFSMVRNNLLYANSASGIAGWDDGAGTQWGTHDNEFYNNTIIQASNGRWAITLLNGSINNRIKNNILLHLGTRGSINLDSTSEPGLDSDYNAVVNVFSYNDGASFVNLATWQGRGHDQHSFVSNSSALFVDPALNNYHLRSGSPAINTGTFLANVTNDLDGNSRPQDGAHDIGCYETVSGCTDTLPPSTSITSPANNAAVSGTITISATASDDCGVTKVEFFVDGNLLTTDTSSPYSASWNTASVSNATHQLNTRAYDGANRTTDSSVVNVNVNNGNVFSDDFQDGNASGWTFTSGTWSVVNGDLTGTARNGDALSPNFGGCTNCAIDTDVRIVTASGRVSVLGWYQNANTYVELQIFDDKNKYFLKQFSNGTVVAKKSVQRVVATNTYYNIKLNFNGTNFQVYVNGTLIITLRAAVTPSGRVGFRVWSPNTSTKTGSMKGVVVQ